MIKARLLFFLLCFSNCISFTPSCKNRAVTTKNEDSSENYVYICRSRTAYVYHSSPNCTGLRKCTHEIIKITLKEAGDKYSRRPCKLCVL